MVVTAVEIFIALHSLQSTFLPRASDYTFTVADLAGTVMPVHKGRQKQRQVKALVQVEQVNKGAGI